MCVYFRHVVIMATDVAAYQSFVADPQVLDFLLCSFLTGIIRAGLAAPYRLTCGLGQTARVKPAPAELLDNLPHSPSPTSALGRGCMERCIVPALLSVSCLVPQSPSSSVSHSRVCRGIRCFGFARRAQHFAHLIDDDLLLVLVVPRLDILDHRQQQFPLIRPVVDEH